MHKRGQSGRKHSGLRIVRGSRGVPGIHERAKAFRKAMTLAEKRFWGFVRNDQIDGLSFRRQQPIDGFIVDFYCDALRLAVEIDGEVHLGQKEYDSERDAILRKRGVQLLRFTNEQVLHRMADVLREIRAFQGASRPSPRGGGVMPAEEEQTRA